MSASLTQPTASFDRLPGSAAYAACDAIVVVDAQQRIVLFNPAAQRMFGYSAAEVLGSPLSRLIPAELREAHARYLGDFDRSGGAEARMGERGFVTALRANGERFAAEASISRAEFIGTSGPQPVFIALLRDLAREFGKTVVMVTHDPRGEAYVDEIHHLDKGVLLDSVAGKSA